MSAGFTQTNPAASCASTRRRFDNHPNSWYSGRGEVGAGCRRSFHGVMTMNVRNICFPLKLLLINGALFIALLVMVEGGASLFLFLAEIAKSEPEIAERSHTRYDPELGWVNIPNAYVPNIYGQGKYVRINSQGFRSEQEFSPKIPAASVRIICSGDSFTFGYGVANDKTWCALLSATGGRVETLNMGQGGYGVDQSYLWYLRDGVKFDSDIHLFTFIGDDFERMVHAEFFGYGKPLLQLENNDIRVTNVPVPNKLVTLPWINRHRTALASLRLLQLTGRTVPAAAEPSPANLQLLIPKMFANLQKVDEGRHSVPVFLYLPTREDFTGEYDELRAGLKEICAKLGVVYFDLADEARQLAPAEREKLYIPDNSLPGYVEAGGHYTEEGNRYIAALIAEKLRSLPNTAARLAADRRPRPGRH